MMARCYNPKDIGYSNYGGRGIRVCNRWHNLEDFLKDMGHPQPGLTLERIDNRKCYGKGNCKWATYKEQNNNKRNNVLLTYEGKTQTVRQWSKELDVSQYYVRKYIREGIW